MTVPEYLKNGGREMTVPEYLKNVTITHAPEPAPVDYSPVITDKQKEDNLRRAKFHALVTVMPDGTRS
jgi:hypothetical protein